MDKLVVLQQKELEILKELKRICEKNNITYFLAFGTLIGAVRHKGFIPWDDDIDVCMNYSDYISFEDACKTDLSDAFFLQTRETEPKAGLSFNKLRMNNSTLITDNMADKDINHGINIDIYPIYNIADNRFMRKIQLACAAIYMLLEAEQAPQNHGKLINIMGRIILSLPGGSSKKRLKEFCHKSMARYETETTKYKGMLFGNMNICKKVYPSFCFETAIPILFENDEFAAPIGFDDYLKSRYGDYLTLPPVEERGAKLEHIVLIDAEKSYLEYKGKAYCINNY